MQRDSRALMINSFQACRNCSNATSLRTASTPARKKTAEEMSELFITGEVHMRDLMIDELSHVYGAGGKGGCGGKGGSKGGSKGKSKSHKSKNHKSKSHKSKCR